MMAMFLDEQIKSFESRSIMRHCLACLENVSQHCTVVVLDGRTTSPLHKQLKHTMRPYLKQSWKEDGLIESKDDSIFRATKNTIFLMSNQSIIKRRYMP